jgi:hypothetical protein
MPFKRCYPRTSDTYDISATLVSNGRRIGAHRVLNLSAGGMLITGAELGLGETTRFEIAGPHFRSAGLAQVAHRSPQATGLRFLEVDEPSDSQLLDVVVGRVRRDHEVAARRTSPGSYLG